MMKYTAYIWDFDGTLFDSYPHISAAFAHVLREEGIPYLEEDVTSALIEKFSACRDRYGMTQEQYSRARQVELDYAFRPAIKPFPGVGAVLRAICEAGGRNFLCTNRDRRAWDYLRLFGFDQYFAGSADASMGFPYKPAPDSVAHLCRMYGLNPAETVMIGDRDVDMLAGEAVGCATCFFISHPVEGEICATHTVSTMVDLAGVCEIPLSEADMLSPEAAETIRTQAAAAAQELCREAHLTAGQIVAVGCSSSEITGERIGSSSSPEAAEAVLAGLTSVFAPRGIYVAAQCCEHLNRALIIEREAAVLARAEMVNVVPMPKAGGAFATAAYAAFRDPVAVSAIAADAGLDIGGTLIGMHLKRVAVPLRLQVRQIGQASVAAARVRAPFAGGIRAVYSDGLL